MKNSSVRRPPVKRDGNVYHVGVSFYSESTAQAEFEDWMKTVAIPLLDIEEDDGELES